MEGSGHALIEVLFRNLLRRIEKNHEKTSVKIVGVLVSTRAHDLAKTSLERYY
jgi:hypothetical protein